MFSAHSIATGTISCLVFILRQNHHVEAFVPPKNAVRGSSVGERLQKSSYKSLLFTKIDEDVDDGIVWSALFAPPSRRSVLLHLATVIPSASSGILLPQTAHAGTNKVHISAYWKSVDGLNSLDSSKQFVSFDTSSYTAMMDDPARTPFFQKAIVQRLNSAPEGPKSQLVLDLGTGPFALFAIIAAQAGAGKVYAIEANPEAAKLARAQIKKLGFEDVITVIEGFSTDVALPDGVKADFAVAEIVGSVATEEGAYATILDAHRRLVKNPSDPSNWIPSRIQTLAAPASYTLHNLFQPPAFDWGKLGGEPVRFNCRDEGLQLLAEPAVIEDVSFSDINAQTAIRNLKFTVDGERVDDNIVAFKKEFRRGRLGEKEVEEKAEAAGKSLTGIALWPRLIVDGEGKIEVNSRSYPRGGHQRSHWQTVLPIMCDEPVPVKGGDEVLVDVDFAVSGDVLRPPTYKLEVDIIQT